MYNKGPFTIDVSQKINYRYQYITWLYSLVVLGCSWALNDNNIRRLILCTS